MENINENFTALNDDELDSVSGGAGKVDPKIKCEKCKRSGSVSERRVGMSSYECHCRNCGHRWTRAH